MIPEGLLRYPSTEAARAHRSPGVRARAVAHVTWWGMEHVGPTNPGRGEPRLPCSPVPLGRTLSLTKDLPIWTRRSLALCTVRPRFLSPRLRLPAPLPSYLTQPNSKQAQGMAAFAAVSSSLPTAISRLHSRSSLTAAARTSLAAATSGSSSFACSSVFGKRLVGSVLGFTLAHSASSIAVRGMETVTASAAQVKSGSSIYDFVVKDIIGNDVELRQYKGKVLLIVNVASACGLTTTNYTELAEIYTKYKDQDFEILAFPCNQFGGQEPGSNEQIKQFACTRFKAEYPIFDKINVNGSQEAPLYKYLKSQKGGGMLGDGIKWNFAKFLVDKNGNVVDRYAPTTPPSKIEKNIKKYLSN